MKIIGFPYISFKPYPFAFVIVLILSASFSIPIVPAAAPQDLTALLPADTLVVVRAHNVPELLRKWDDSPFYRFYGDARAGAFFRPLREKIEAFKKSMSDEKGVAPDRLWRFFSGDLVLAGLPAPSGSSDPVQWVLLFQHNGDPQMLTQFKKVRNVPGATVTQTSEQYAGFRYSKVHVIREVAAELPAAKPLKHKRSAKKRKSSAQSEPDLSLELKSPAPALLLKKQVVAEYDDYYGPSLIVHASSAGQPLEKVLSLLANPAAGPSLARQPEFVRLERFSGAGGDIKAYVHVAALSRWLERQASAGPLGRLFDLRQLNLAEIKAAAASLTLQRDRAAYDLAVLAPPPRQGISRLLFLGAGEPPQAARLVPPDAVAYAAAGFSLGELWKLFMETVRTASPTLELALASQLSIYEQNSGLSVEKSLIGPLGAQAARFILPAGKARNPRELATYMVSLRDGPAFRDALLGFLNYGSQAYGAWRLEKSGAGPWPVWSVVPGRPDAPSSGGQAFFHFCVTDQWLLFGARPSGLEAIVKHLRNPKQASLAKQEQFRRVMEQLPRDRFAEVYLDPSGIRRLLELSALAEPSGGKRGKGKDGGGALNLALLPSSELCGEFFGPIAGAARHDQDLLRVQGFMLYPAGRN